jgi:hypothetical protein
VIGRTAQSQTYSAALYYTNINPSQKVRHFKCSDRKYPKNPIRFQKEWGRARADLTFFDQFRQLQ